MGKLAGGKSSEDIYKSKSEEPTIKDSNYLTNFKKQVEEGINQLNNGKTLSNEEVKNRLKSSINKLLLQ